MWWKTREDPPLDRQAVDGIISLLVRIDARLEQLIELEEEDGEEESDA